MKISAPVPGKQTASKIVWMYRTMLEIRFPSIVLNAIYHSFCDPSHYIIISYCRPGSAPKLIYRPIKIGGSTTQKATFQPSSSVAAVTTSSAVAKPTGSTVFSRLGKQPSSGSKVCRPPLPLESPSTAAVSVGGVYQPGEQCGAGGHGGALQDGGRDQGHHHQGQLERPEDGGGRVRPQKRRHQLRSEVQRCSLSSFLCS
jgi:hypothetical protein